MINISYKRNSYHNIMILTVSSVQIECTCVPNIMAVNNENSKASKVNIIINMIVAGGREVCTLSCNNHNNIDDEMMSFCPLLTWLRMVYSDLKMSVGYNPVVSSRSRI